MQYCGTSPGLDKVRNLHACDLCCALFLESCALGKWQWESGRGPGFSPSLGDPGLRCFCPCRMCFRRCSQDCRVGGPSTLQYKLLPLPLGVRAHRDVARVAAFSEAGSVANLTELHVLEPDPHSPFSLRPLHGGLGAVYTRRALSHAGLYRLTVRAAAPRYSSIYVLLIAVSPYPY